MGCSSTSRSRGWQCKQGPLLPRDRGHAPDRRGRWRGLLRECWLAHRRHDRHAPGHTACAAPHPGAGCPHHSSACTGMTHARGRQQPQLSAWHWVHAEAAPVHMPDRLCLQTLTTWRPSHTSSSRSHTSLRLTWSSSLQATVRPQCLHGAACWHPPPAAAAAAAAEQAASCFLAGCRAVREDATAQPSVCPQPHVLVQMQQLGTPWGAVQSPQPASAR